MRTKSRREQRDRFRRSVGRIASSSDFTKKDFELSGSLIDFTGIKVLLSAINTVPQSGNFILLHRFVDKTDKEL